MSIGVGEIVWVCGQLLGDGSDAKRWEFQGVFLTQQEAVDACRDWKYFIGPVRVGRAIDHESTEWDGAYYPISRKVTKEK